jgi:hypothetical protein
LEGSANAAEGEHEEKRRERIEKEVRKGRTQVEEWIRDGSMWERSGEMAAEGRGRAIAFLVFLRRVRVFEPVPGLPGLRVSGRAAVRFFAHAVPEMARKMVR